MTGERWARVQELFYSAADLAAGESRDAFLRQSCGDDESLRHDVSRLLSVSETSSVLEESVLAAAHQVAGLEPESGARIGAYRIIRELGHGGMGAVYLAVRDDDQYHQQVALKVSRTLLNREGSLLRFRAERQILADLPHPNIARLLDGGVTPEGVPYLVMEYVDGVPIDEYCRNHSLSLMERLALFRTICQAVQLAHQKLIVHRDLKPGNILVTSDGTPKLLDFGIAKLLKPDPYGEAVAMTGVADRLMTPDYASPEQVRGEAITTATDVYALGVLLYELLTNKRPFRIPTGATAVEIETTICEQNPDAPSTVADRALRLTPDLDNIVLMALRKEPDRRYGSAVELAEDVRRFMSGFPVQARPNTFRYRTSKFIRRNRLAVIAASLIVVLIGSFGVGMATLAKRVARERDAAMREKQTAEQTSQFLVDLFLNSDPEKSRGETVTAREILDSAAANAESRLSGQPEVQARMLSTLGKVYENLGLYQTSRAMCEKTLALQRRIYGNQSLEVAGALKDLAELARRDLDFTAAEALARESLEIRRRISGSHDPDLAESLNTVGLVLQQKGDLIHAEPFFREALSMRELLKERDHLETAVLSNLGEVLRQRGDCEGSEFFLRQCLAIRRASLGGPHPRLALTTGKLASALVCQGRIDEAEPLARETIAIRQKVYPKGHPDLAGAEAGLANLLRERGDFPGAEEHYRKAAEEQRRIVGGNNAKAGEIAGEWGTLELARNRLPVAEELFRQSLASLRATLPAGHPSLVTPLLGLGSVLARKSRPAEAEPLLAEALQIRRQTMLPGHWQIAEAQGEWAACLMALPNHPEAARLLSESYDQVKAKRGLQAKETVRLRQLLPVRAARR